MPEQTRDEKSLLLFFETCAVDTHGNVVTEHLGDEERSIAARWHDEGFVTYQRIKFDNIAQLGTRPANMNVALSDEAWALAHQYREERGKRNLRPVEELVIRKRKTHA